MNRLNRIKGGLYGVAIGDALGGTTEFMTRSEVKNKYGYLTEIIGGGVWDLEPGEVTDDTMMTLAVGEGSSATRMIRYRISGRTLWNGTGPIRKISAISLEEY
jgi:ADP-ribosyl-[dinitrogen reductase] hydrolase